METVATRDFGYKFHITIDRYHGLIRKWTLTDAARHDGRELAGLLGRSNKAAPVWADTAYQSGKTEKRIADAELVSKIHFRRAPGKALTPRNRQVNAARSKVRSAVEHPSSSRRAAWASSSGPSESRGRRRRSASPTLPSI